MKTIEKLTDDQISKFQSYVDKWDAISLKSGACDVEESKKWISKMYTNVGLQPPKYWFHFVSPENTARAVWMIDIVSDFSDADTDTTVHGDFAKWENLFNDFYNQYSSQYQESDVTWNDDTKARMRSKISKAFISGEQEDKIVRFTDEMMYGAMEGPFLAFYDFLLNETDMKEKMEPLAPIIELCNHCGFWTAYEEVAILQDRPEVVNIQDDNLHCEEGPAFRFSDGSEGYFLENFWFDKEVVTDPQSITVEMIETETNAERRRILLERHGYLEYFEKSGAKIIDRDMVIVDPEQQTTMPRMLVETNTNDLFLVGSDGSTERVYVMPITSRDRVEQRVGKITTCRQAHQLISGLDESKCLAQS